MRKINIALLSCLLFLSTTAFAQDAAAGSPGAPPVAQPAPQAEAPKPERQWRFGLGVGYQLATSAAQFNNVSVVGGGQQVSATGSLTYNQTYVLSAEGRFVRKHAWGFIGGLDYEGQRQFQSGSFSGGGQTVQLTGGSGASKVQFTSVYASAVYRWEDFYLPFGLNFSFINFTPAAGATATGTTQGGVGAQIGIGYQFNDWFALEAYSWATAMQLNIADSSTSLSTGTGYVPDFVLFAKFLF